MPLEFERGKGILPWDANCIRMLQFVDLWPLKAVNQPEAIISTGLKVFIFEDV